MRFHMVKPLFDTVSIAFLHNEAGGRGVINYYPFVLDFSANCGNMVNIPWEIVAPHSGFWKHWKPWGVCKYPIRK